MSVASGGGGGKWAQADDIELRRSNSTDSETKLGSNAYFVKLSAVNKGENTCEFLLDSLYACLSIADLGRFTYRTISRTLPYPASRIVDRNVSLNLIILILFSGLTVTLVTWLRAE